MIAQRVSTTAERLKQRMEELGIKQVDIVEACKPYGLIDKKDIVGKSHISQWVNGVNEPSQNKLTILARVLHVTEAWLLGYDVPKEPIVSTIRDNPDEYHDNEQITPQINIVSGAMSMMSKEQQDQVIGVLRAMFINDPKVLEKLKRKDDNDDYTA